MADGSASGEEALECLQGRQEEGGAKYRLLCGGVLTVPGQGRKNQMPDFTLSFQLPCGIGQTVIPILQLEEIEACPTSE